MKEFDFTTESEQDISLDDILGEFRASAKESDADALYSYLVSDAELPADDTLPELESEDYQSSDFSYSDSFTSGVDTELYVPDELELIDDVEDDDVSVYVPGKKHVSAPVTPEVEETADFADEEVSELPDKKKSARSSASDEARRYIAGIQGVFGRSRRKKERRSLKELQEELDEETFLLPEEDAGDEPAPPALVEDTPEESYDFDSVFAESRSREPESDFEDASGIAEDFSDENGDMPESESRTEDFYTEDYSDENKIIEPEYNKAEPEIDSRFNLGGRRRNTGIRFGSRDVDMEADEAYSQVEQKSAPISHWIEGEEEQVVDESVIGTRKVGKRRQKQLEREEMLRRQKQSEESVAEDFDDDEIEPAEYADADIPQDIHFNIDEDAFPPTFRAYLSSIIASVFLRLRGTNRNPTNGTMVDTDEDLGAEVSPAAAYKYYGSFIPFQRLRLRISGLMLILLCYLSAGLPVPGMLNDYKVAAAAALALELTIMLSSLDVFTNAITKIFRLKFGADSLAALSCLVTALDAALIAATDSAAPHMPLCALSALSLYGVALSSAYTTRALRKATRVPAIGKHSYAVTGEIKFKDKQLTLLKSLRSAKGFVRRAEEMPPDEMLFGKLSIFILLLSLLLSTVIAVVHKNAADFIYILSAVLGPAVPCTALLAFALPFLLGTNRIFKSGAAIAGWSGLCDIGTCRSVIITDRDLFPESAVSIKEAKIFSDESPEKVISYAGTLVCASGSCISHCFAKLMEENNCSPRHVSELEYLSGGGIRALIEGHQVLCGSTDLMRLMNVRISYRLTSKTAVLLAIDGVLYGIFTIEYTPLPQVRTALTELMRSSRHPVFAIRDFNVTPEMLHNVFDLATDGYDFPPYVERFKLSEASKTRSGTGKIAAVICTEGLSPLTEAADVGHSMYLSVRINLVITVIAAFVGMFVPAVLLLVKGSIAVSLLISLMLVWVIPVVLVSLFVLKP